MPGATATRVLQRYLSDEETGLVSVLQRALQELYQPDVLPHNPFFQVAEVVAAHSDQSPGWRLTDAQVGAWADARCAVELVDPQQHLACLAPGVAWGLPHMLRCTSRQGIEALRNVLVRCLPPCFFPDAAPTADADDCVTQVLPSLQGACLAYDPTWPALPALHVRCDVAIRARSLDAALHRFAMRLVQDMRELLQAGPHHGLAISIQPGLADEVAGSEVTRIPVEMVSGEDSDEFEDLVRRLVPRQQCVTCDLLLAVDLRSGVSSAGAPSGGAGLRYVAATRSCYLHFCPAQSAVQAFASLPHEALLTGVFLDEAAMQSYVALAPDETPYSMLDALAPAMLGWLPAMLRSGRSPAGWLTLLQLVLVQDETAIGGAVPTTGAMVPFADLLDPAAGLLTDANPLTPCTANLLRMLRSPGTALMSLADEVHTLQRAVAKHAADLTLEDEYEVEDADVVRRQQRQAHIAAHLASLPARMRRELAHCPVAGIAACAEELLSQTDLDHASTSMEPDTWRQLAYSLAGCAAVLEACCATSAQQMLTRCLDIQSLLAQLQVEVQPEPPVIEEGTHSWWLPSWALQVPKVAQLRVEAGSLVERLAREGVIFQHAVDIGLDSVLGSVFALLTAPPLPANPFRPVERLLHAAAWRMELAEAATEEAIAGVQNQLTRLDSASFMYAAAPASLPSSRGHKVDTLRAQARVYGTYAAVALADAVALQRLHQLLPPFLTSRCWQQGAYQMHAMPALSGDACMSKAMALEQPCRLTAAGAWEGPVAGASLQSALHMHPRAADLVTEMHYLVEGPDLHAAAECFAHAVLARLADLAQHTLHLLVHLALDRGSRRRKVWSSFQLAEGLDKALRALRSRAMAMGESQQHCAEVRAHVAVPEGVYMPLMQRIYFSYHSHCGRDLNDARSSKAGPKLGPAEHWDASVYRRVFLQSEDASAYANWHRPLGDPAHPFHAAHAATCFAAEARQLLADGDALQASKLRVLAALAEGNADEATHMAAACRSTAQELANLHTMNSSLVALSGPLPDLAGQVDGHRLSRMLTLYLNRMTLLVVSPRHCSIPGVPHLLAGQLHRLAQAVKGPNAEELDVLLPQLAAYTRACQHAIAADVHTYLTTYTAHPVD